jgi:hypothetical protein
VGLFCVIEIPEERIDMGDRVARYGNVRPTSVMVLGTTDDVQTNVDVERRAEHDKGSAL